MSAERELASVHSNRYDSSMEEETSDKARYFWSTTGTTIYTAVDISLDARRAARTGEFFFAPGVDPVSSYAAHLGLREVTPFAA